ncbi:MAG: hypothetical protein HC819_20360 [Cyclobacteriaceae bacterium]|nr:hypothetical protein [Cyclobacteriaceae bacterium]
MVRRIFVILFFLLAFFQVFGQQKGRRPKVGLVLSGGGAKGLAHIGIIRAMEKAGLTPDYVTGTSMGSIVGGLYSIGYTADEIEKISKEIVWDAVLSNKIPLNEITFEEKEYYGRYIAELPIDGIKVGLPRGLIEGQQLSELLSRLTRTVHDIEDFSKLPIPFACVAADIATGEPVVLDHGSFPRAIRASMSIPTVFTPVEIDGRLLVDGGLVRNFPVEEVKAMGADIVIGVFVSSDLNTKEELNNLIAVLTQSAFVTSALDSRRQKEMVDIYIEPKLSEFNTGSFNLCPDIIKKGDEMGEQFFQTFKNLADSLALLGPPPAVYKMPQKNEYLITEINIIGNQQISSNQIKRKMKVEEGSILSIDEIEKQISLIYGTRFFDKVEYEIVRHGPISELNIIVQEAPDGYLKLAVQYDSENDVGILSNITYRNLLLPNTRALLEFNLSKNPSLDLNYLMYIGEKQNAGIMLGLEYLNNTLPFYEDNIEISRFDSDFSKFFFQVQSTSFRNFAFGGRLQMEFSDLSPRVGELGRVIQRIQNRDIGAELYLEFNDMDRRYYPSKGNQLSLLFKQVFQVKNKISQYSEDSVSRTQFTIEQFLDPFVAFECHYTFALPLSGRFSLISNNSFVLSTLPDPLYNIADYYFLGGFNPNYPNASPFWGVYDKEFLAPNFFYTALGLQYELFNNVYLTAMSNYLDVQYPMDLLYNIQVDNYLDGKKRRLGYGLSLGYNSPLGPISFSMARDTSYGKVLANINFGFWVR